MEKYEKLYPYEKDAYKFGHVPHDSTYLKELSKKISAGKKYGIDNNISQTEIDKMLITSNRQKNLSNFM